MARLFNKDPLDFLSHSDISTARFDKDTTWTILAFFRCENVASDDNGIVSKWEESTNRQFVMRVDAGTGSQEFEVWLDGNRKILSSTAVIDESTWYLASVACNGASVGTDDLTCRIYDMAATSILIKNGGHTTNDGLTADIRIGKRDASADEMKGEIAYVAYFNTEFTADEVLNYLRNPYAVVAAKGSSGCEFFLPLVPGDLSPEIEIVHGRDFTVNGSPTKGDNPPMPNRMPPMFIPSLAAAVPPAVTRRVFIVS